MDSSRTSHNMRGKSTNDRNIGSFLDINGLQKELTPRDEAGEGKWSEQTKEQEEPGQVYLEMPLVRLTSLPHLTHSLSFTTISSRSSLSVVECEVSGWKEAKCPPLAHRSLLFHLSRWFSRLISPALGSLLMPVPVLTFTKCSAPNHR